jgi:hypothetical protein
MPFTLGITFVFIACFQVTLEHKIKDSSTDLNTISFIVIGPINMSKADNFKADAGPDKIRIERTRSKVSYE